MNFLLRVGLGCPIVVAIANPFPLLSQIEAQGYKEIEPELLPRFPRVEK